MSLCNGLVLNKREKQKDYVIIRLARFASALTPNSKIHDKCFSGIRKVLEGPEANAPRTSSRTSSYMECVVGFYYLNYVVARSI